MPLQFVQFPLARELDRALQLLQGPFKILKTLNPSQIRIFVGSAFCQHGIPYGKRALASAERFFQRLASEAVTDSFAAATSAGVKDFPVSGVCAANM